MKIFNLVLALLFLSFAIVQYNDPDPWVWISLYLAVTLVCVLAAWRIYYQLFILLLIFGSGIWFGSLVPEFIQWLRDGAPTITGSMKAESIYIELIREFFGLFIIISTLTFQYFQSKKELSVDYAEEY